MADSKQHLLMKIASQDKAPELIVNLCVARKMSKVARTIALNDYTKDLAMNKQAELSDYLDKAWTGIQDWWKDDRNRAGAAAGILTGLGGYGLTSLLPGANKNKLARLLMSLGLAYGGYKAGQWGADYLQNKKMNAALDDIWKKELKPDTPLVVSSNPVMRANQVYGIPAGGAKKRTDGPFVE